jgi:hypothetical protein
VQRLGASIAHEEWQQNQRNPLASDEELTRIEA